MPHPDIRVRPFQEIVDYWSAHIDECDIAISIRQRSGNATVLSTARWVGMTPANAEEKAFLRAAVAAIPRITEIICEFPLDDQTGALEIAERRFIKAALEFGCTEMAAQSRVSMIMQRLRMRLEDRRNNKKKLQALLHQLTKSK